MADVTKGKNGKPVVTIYFNPKCGTARKVLGLIRDAGIEPEIIEYLKTPPNKTTLKRLIKDIGGGAKAVVRDKQKEFKAAGLDRDRSSETELVDAMLEQPILINRPIVVTDKGTRLCRPADCVEDLLP